MKQKKELLGIVLVFMLGVLFILVMCINAKQYDKTHPTYTNQVESFSNDL